MTRLTRRQSRFIEELPRSRSLAEAARRAGYSSKFAGQSGYLALRRIAAKAPEALDSVELTLEELIEKVIKPGLEAQKTLYFAHEGQVRDMRTVPDHEAQFRFIVLALKLHGIYPKKS